MTHPIWVLHAFPIPQLPPLLRFSPHFPVLLPLSSHSPSLLFTHPITLHSPHLLISGRGNLSICQEGGKNHKIEPWCSQCKHKLTVALVEKARLDTVFRGQNMCRESQKLVETETISEHPPKVGLKILVLSKPEVLILLLSGLRSFKACSFNIFSSYWRLAFQLLFSSVTKAHIHRYQLNSIWSIKIADVKNTDVAPNTRGPNKQSAQSAFSSVKCHYWFCAWNCHKIARSLEASLGFFKYQVLNLHSPRGLPHYTLLLFHSRLQPDSRVLSGLEIVMKDFGG